MNADWSFKYVALRSATDDCSSPCFYSLIVAAGLEMGHYGTVCHHTVTSIFVKFCTEDRGWPRSTQWQRNIAESFNPLSKVYERYRQTDRQRHTIQVCCKANMYLIIWKLVSLLCLCTCFVGLYCENVWTAKQRTELHASEILRDLHFIESSFLSSSNHRAYICIGLTHMDVWCDLLCSGPGVGE